ncbi:DNA-binding transcriptional regulator YdaS (Cro superfamily) [Novosphingobium sp. SG751A]|uniref:transcriptional regulator n=1 Tax=Novosphingobium sp. SG751A TaxID=2587000 RepID=UPI0015533CCE|nr:YdaS family helix-turn-helix protein [Novosphingobium sp. SG751A]NOW46204.1 DNA-binding transcriptional regulator YdaS (Cro superfamily) [Novosphingobium sp. SG751A]
METILTPYEALISAVERAGGQSALARICGVGQPAVWKWLQSSKRVPDIHVFAIEAATGVSRHSLRPDLYPLDIAPGPRWYGVDQGANRRHFNGMGFSKGAAA